MTDKTRVCVFISYSWTNREHEKWILDLATRLSEDGIHVLLDKWDLIEGQDVYNFMEKMVKSDGVDKVLIICDSGYVEKADDRKGGVGTETQIITPELYKDVNQEKFIPIISEVNQEGNPYIPVYISTRKYIDMSNREIYEEGYVQLLRSLYQRPQHRRPALGQPPNWLFTEEVNHYKTSNINKQLSNAIINNPKIVDGLANRFIRSFFEILDEKRTLNFDEEREDDEIIKEVIDDYLLLRDDYIDFVEILCEINEKGNLDILVDFFEKMYHYTHAEAGKSTYYEYGWDHNKFLLQELLIYTVIILLKFKCYKLLSEFIHTEFFVKDNVYSQELKHGGFNIFYSYLTSLEEIRKTRIRSNKFSITAEMLIQRANERKYASSELVYTDLLLYYLSALFFKNEIHQLWFPRTYIYLINPKIPFLQRLISQRHFENVKTIFGVKSIEELKKELKNFKHPYKKGYSGESMIPDIKWHINPDDVCTVK